VTIQLEKSFGAVGGRFFGRFVAGKGCDEGPGQIFVYEGFFGRAGFEVCAKDGEDLGPAFLGILLGKGIILAAALVELWEGSAQHLHLLARRP